MYLYWIRIFAIAFVVACSVNLQASEDDHSDHRHHEAHVHGEAMINILIDDSSFIFELNSPAVNLLGFEHEPETHGEEEKVNQINNKLIDYRNILSISDINCVQSEYELTAPYGEHAEDNHHHHHHGDDHSEYYLFYSLKCDAINDLKKIKVELFESFKGFKSVDVKWTYFSDAGSFEATEEKRIIKIK